MKDNKYSFFESYHKALSRVSDERYGRVVRAMSEFAFKGIAPSFADDADWIVWELVKPIIERGQEISEARAEAGRRGKGVSRNKGNRNAAKGDDKSKANQSNSIQNNTKQYGIGKGIGIGNDNNKLTNVSIGRLSDDLLVSFEKFWSMYDKKRKRPACEKKWNDTCKARSEAGKKGMLKRWGDNKRNKNNKCYQKITSVTDNVNDNVNDNVSTNVDEEKPTNVGKESAFSFDGFWDLYGKKVDRKKCESKWNQRRFLSTDGSRLLLLRDVGRMPIKNRNKLSY